MVTRALLPAIDYTSRDYVAIRSDLIRLIQQRVPSWTAADPNDFGVALVEAVAYAADQLHYYMDRVAGEAYLETALQRESVGSLARLLGYTPTSAIPARVGLEFRNSSVEDVVLPERTRVQATFESSNGALIRSFETDREITVTGTPTDSVPQPVAVTATEGRSYRNEQIAVSSGLTFQRYVLPRYSVLPETVVIETSLGEVDALWWQVERLEDASDEDRVFMLQTLTDGSTAVVFGDGVNGEVPALHAVIRASYRVGGGQIQVSPGIIDTLVEPDNPFISVTNPQASYGGRDAESLNSIRVRAARGFRSRRRAVTIYDFMSIAAAAPGIAKAKAVGNNGTSVTLFAIADDDGTGSPSMSDQAKEDLRSYMSSVSMAGVDITVVDGLWVPVHIKIEAQLIGGASREEVKTEIEARLSDLLGFDNVGFDNRLTVADISNALFNIKGVSYVNVRGMGANADPRSLEPIFFDQIYQGAVPYWDSSLLELHMAGGR